MKSKKTMEMLFGTFLLATFLLTIIPGARADCPTPCISFTGSIDGNMQRDTTGVICLCQAADYLQAKTDANTTYQCQTDLNTTRTNYTNLSVDYNKLNDDKNGISNTLSITQGILSGCINDKQHQLDLLADKDKNYTEIMGKLQKYELDGWVCQDVNKYCAATTQVCGNCTSGVTALTDSQIQGSQKIENMAAQSATGLNTLSQKIDLSYILIVITIAVVAIGIVYIGKKKLKINLAPQEQKPSWPEQTRTEYPDRRKIIQEEIKKAYYKKPTKPKTIQEKPKPPEEITKPGGEQNAANKTTN